SVQAVLRHVMEESVELVKLFLGNGIKLVVVALGTGDGQAQPDGAGGVDAIDDVGVVVFLGYRPALEVDHVVTVKAAGDLLGQGGRGQQIAGQLLDGKPVKGQIGIEGVDPPLPPARHVPAAVDVVTVRIGKAGRVQPLQAHAFSIARRGQ